MGRFGRFTLWGAGALAALAAAYLCWQYYIFANAQPAVPVDYVAQMRTLIQTEQSRHPESGNAYEAAAAAGQLLFDIRDELQSGLAPGEQGIAVDYATVTGVGGWNAPQPQNLAARTSRAIALFIEHGGDELLAQAASFPRAVRHIPNGSLYFNTQANDGVWLRELVRHCAARMAIAARERDWPTYTACFAGGLAASRVCMQQAAFLDDVQGCAALRFMYTQLSHNLTYAEPPAVVLRALRESMELQWSRLPTASFVLEAHILRTEDWLQFSHNADGRMTRAAMSTLAQDTGPGQPVYYGVASSPWGWVTVPMLPTRTQQAAAASAFFEWLRPLAALPPFERRKAPFDPAAFIQGISNRLPINSELNLGNSILWIRDMLTTEHHGTRLLLAIMIFKQEHGRFPTVLSELVPAYIPDLPVDPYSGASFVYRPGEAPGTTPALYSVGFDQIDNGGTAPDPNGPPATSPSSPGGDEVFLPTHSTRHPPKP